MAPDVRRIEINENGIIGVLFLPPENTFGQKFPGTIVLDCILQALIKKDFKMKSFVCNRLY